MKEKFSKLIDVKTLVTLGVVGTCLALAFKGALDASKVYELTITIVAFYFGNKAINNNK
jgi:hypothetical protein